MFILIDKSGGGVYAVTNVNDKKNVNVFPEPINSASEDLSRRRGYILCSAFSRNIFSNTAC